MVKARTLVQIYAPAFNAAQSVVEVGVFFQPMRSGASFTDPCVCQVARKRTLLMQNAALPSRYLEARLIESQKDKQNAEAFSILQLMAKEHTPAGRGLVLTGQPGLGKTWLAVSFLRALMDLHQTRVVFRDFSHLLADLRSGYNQGRAEQELLQPLVEVDMLLIDELGKGRNNQWEQTILDTIVTLRYNAQRPCMFTTNYALRANQTLVERYRTKDALAAEAEVEIRDTLVQRIGERILSRLRETCEFIHLQGEDRRDMISLNPI